MFIVWEVISLSDWKFQFVFEAFHKLKIPQNPEGFDMNWEVWKPLINLLLLVYWIQSDKNLKIHTAMMQYMIVWPIWLWPRLLAELLNSRVSADKYPHCGFHSQISWINPRSLKSARSVVQSSEVTRNMRRLSQVTTLHLHCLHQTLLSLQHTTLHYTTQQNTTQHTTSHYIALHLQTLQHTRSHPVLQYTLNSTTLHECII